MANLKALRQRIRSVTNTRQITKAMKMVAAAKLRRSQERAQSARGYSLRMNRMVRSIAARVGKGPAPALLTGRENHAKRIELLMFTADRGLCGSFNSTVIRSVRSKIAEMQASGFDVSITCVGRKGSDVLKRQFSSKIRRVHIGISKNLTFEKAERDIAQPLLKDFDDERFDTCFMVFNTFESAMTQTLTWQQIIPVPVPEGGDEVEESGPPPTYEPEEDEMLAELLPRNIAVQIYQAMAESDASENGARMSAMDNAVRNAGGMLRRLNIKYNRTRQAAITTELMEIISGSESLKG